MEEDKVYQLKVGIADAKPPIWRRVLVPARTTLADLHPIIQALMGWQDGHLHQFEAPVTGGTLLALPPRRDYVRYVPTTDPLGQPFDWMMDDDDSKDEAKACLDEVAPTEKFRFRYIYDMGDNWEHDILVEKILPADPEGVYPVCLTGKRNGPIEDCGGIWGYEEMLEILADPAHEEHEERKGWLEDVYGVSTWDGDAFDLEGINRKLEKLRPKKRRVARRRT